MLPFARRFAPSRVAFVVAGWSHPEMPTDPHLEKPAPVAFVKVTVVPMDRG